MANFQQRNSTKIGLIQGKDFGSSEANLSFTINQIRQAAVKGAKIICTQELFNSSYFCREQDTRNFELAEMIPGKTSQILSEIAAELEVVLIACYFEKRSSALYHNSAIVLDKDGTLLGTYRKTHIPQDPEFEEKFYFSPGDSNFPVWKTAYGTIGVLICWDQWFPEAARIMALKGAEILFYPTAIGWLSEEKSEFGFEQHQAWETVQRGHAIANACYLASINRVGVEGSIEFWGQSFVCNSYGSIVQKASSSETETLVVECDRKALEDMRKIWPFFRDRRPETYQSIGQSFIDT